MQFSRLPFGGGDSVYLANFVQQGGGGHPDFHDDAIFGEALGLIGLQNFGLSQLLYFG